MHKFALLLSVAAVAVAVSVPSAAARKRAKDEDGGVVDGSLLRAAAADENDVNGARTGAEPQHNAKLLNRLGMKRVRTSGGGGGENADGNHHRKRLAGQSRSKYGADGKGTAAAAADSQMFVVKLPPHAHYYGDASHQKYRPQQQQQPYKNFNTVPVGFVSNGKPAKVYHWNLPVIMKHALGGVRYRSGGGNDLHQQHQQQHHRVQYGDDIEPVPRRTLYYKPRSAGKPVKKSFVGNGKPDGFYVVGAGKKNAAVQPQYHKIVKTYYGSGD